ncbi:MAG: hypothetical protein NC393_01220 [Clostridium sp.]|nr:hypothetical protein [Clostridium sp.]MCM1170723.1 hypothetical protein [Clostridium sp.]
MKKKLLFFIMVCMTALCSACIPDFFNSPTEVNVVVGGVDGGMLNGARVCEWEEQYAYYDDGVLYYFEDKDSEAQSIQCNHPAQMAMNEDYIYYCQGGVLAAIDLKTMEFHNICSNDGYIRGINVYPDEILVVAEDEHMNLHIYQLLESELNYLGDYNYDFLSVKSHFANRYAQEILYAFSGGKMLMSWYGYFGVYEIGQYQEAKIDVDMPDAVITPEHVAEYEGKVYLLVQQGKGNQGSHNNMEYWHKDWDEIICVDIEAETYESIYKTPGHREQIVNFSVENNEMYLLTDGILYKTDLKGEGERVELANYVGADTLTFEYANDTLFVYDGYKLLGQYK